jgi:hypothetical protein
MKFFVKLLESGAPWWLVVGLIVFVVASVLAVVILAPGLLKRLARGQTATQHQNVIIHNYGTDSPFERVNRRRSNRVGRSRSGLAQELGMLKSDGDEVHVYDLPPEKE